jgi:hypothetical protein
LSIKHITAAALAALAFAAPSHALEGFKPLLGAAVTGGGETLVTVPFTDGTSQDIRSGGLLQLFGGFEYQAPESPFAIQVNLGYHVDDTTATNGSVKFARFPFEVLGFYQFNETYRLGLGLRKANDVKLTSSGATSVGNYKFTGETGLILQGEYLMGAASVYLRYVSEDYKIGRASVSGKHVGLGVSYRF